MTIIRAVFKIIKFLFGVLSIIIVFYFVFFVSLGDKTLYQHLVGISETQEAKVLGREIGKQVEHTKTKLSNTIKEKVPKIVDRVTHGDRDAAGADDGGVDGKSAPKPHSDDDKAALKQLIHRKNEPHAQDRQALNRLIKQKSE